MARVPRLILTGEGRREKTEEGKRKRMEEDRGERREGRGRKEEVVSIYLLPLGTSNRRTSVGRLSFERFKTGRNFPPNFTV